jgi:hypothetical protein
LIELISQKETAFLPFSRKNDHPPHEKLMSIHIFGEDNRFENRGSTFVIYSSSWIAKIRRNGLSRSHDLGMLTFVSLILLSEILEKGMIRPEYP